MDLGIQQQSELADRPGVRVVGRLPGDAAIVSGFAGAVLTASPDGPGALDALARLRAAADAPTCADYHLGSTTSRPRP